ncbi:rCG32283 [Rattus norvegicus]|uniref:RCG32283 n=1 Tax=Rattus norvegicus TaxID=10116 RepID=A6JXR7_RAT|nr:rCG32283 [Rattus norvegicus]
MPTPRISQGGSCHGEAPKLARQSCAEGAKTGGAAWAPRVSGMIERLLHSLHLHHVCGIIRQMARGRQSHSNHRTPCVL